MAKAGDQAPSWHNKLHPQFFEQVEVLRDFEAGFTRIQAECDQRLRDLGRSASQTDRNKILQQAADARVELLARTEQRLREISARFGDVEHNRVAYHYLDAPADEPNREFKRFARYLHWLRHRESFDTAHRLDQGGDLGAYKRITRTGEDLRRIVHRTGGLKPVQGDVQHREMLEMILCFERPPLTAEERADCMDACCPCGKTHDPDALKKQWRRLKKDLGL